MLELTGGILASNPDFASLWNCRRKTLQKIELVIFYCKITQNSLSELFVYILQR